MHRHIATQIALMHATKHAQVRPQPCPHPFTGVGMRFARAIPSRITRPFPRRVAYCGMWPLDRGIAIVLVGVDVRSRPSKLLDMRPQSRLLGIGHDSQAYLTTHAPDR